MSLNANSSCRITPSVVTSAARDCRRPGNLYLTVNVGASSAAQRAGVEFNLYLYAHKCVARASADADRLARHILVTDGFERNLVLGGRTRCICVCVLVFVREGTLLVLAI
jgi:hypothetical protein